VEIFFVTFQPLWAVDNFLDKYCVTLVRTKVDQVLKPICRNAVLDSIRNDTLALYCDKLDSLQTVAHEANLLIHGNNLEAARSFISRHHISQDARILRRVGRDMVSVGPVVGTLLDCIQL
jgi:hypothetical protein